MKNRLEVTAKQANDAVLGARLHGERDDIVSLVEYRLTYLIEQLNPVAKSFARAKNRLLREYALRDPEGEIAWARDGDGEPVVGSYQLDPHRLDEYEAKLEEIESQTHVISWVPMPAKLLENKKGSIPGGALALVALRPFLDLSELELEMDKAIKDEGWKEPEPAED